MCPELGQNGATSCLLKVLRDKLLQGVKNTAGNRFLLVKTMINGNKNWRHFTNWYYSVFRVLQAHEDTLALRYVYVGRVHYWNNLKWLPWYSPEGLFPHWKLWLSPVPHMQNHVCEWTSVSCALVQTIPKCFIETALLPLSLLCTEGLQGNRDFKRPWLNICATVTDQLSGWCPFFPLISRDRQEFQPRL